MPIVLGRGCFSKVYLFELLNDCGEVLEYVACKLQKNRRWTGTCTDIDMLYVQEYEHLKKLACYSGTVHLSRAMESALPGIFKTGRTKFSEDEKESRVCNTRRITKRILAKLDISSPQDRIESNQLSKRIASKLDEANGVSVSLTRRLMSQLAGNDTSPDLPAHVITKPIGEPAERETVSGSLKKREQSQMSSALHAKAEGYEEGENDLRKRLAKNQAMVTDKKNEIKSPLSQMTKRLISELKEQVLLPETAERDKSQMAQLTEKLSSRILYQAKIGTDKRTRRKDSPLTKRLIAKLADTKGNVCAEDKKSVAFDNSFPFRCSPSLFSRRENSLLPMPCPKADCNGELKNCRKEVFDFLYRKTALRFLYCPECFDKNFPGSVKDVYCEEKLSSGELGAGYRITGKEELLEALAKKTGRRDLQVFSFYESYLLPLTVCHFPLNSLIDVISQRPETEILRESAEKNPYFGQFPSRANDENPLEILFLKLKLFARICDSVFHFHKATGKAHLNLEPGSVMLRFLQYSRHPGLVKQILMQGAQRHRIDLDNFQVELLNVSGSLPRKESLACKTGLSEFHCLGPVADLYDLGMLLLHILVGRNKREGDIREILRETLSEIDGNAWDQARKIDGIILRRMSENSGDASFGEYFSSDRLCWTQIKAKLPQELWLEIIVFAFRLITVKFRDFSFYQQGILGEQRENLAIVAQVSAELNGIIAKIERRLFGRARPMKNVVESPVARSKSLLESLRGALASILAKVKGRK